MAELRNAGIIWSQNLKGRGLSDLISLHQVKLTVSANHLIASAQRIKFMHYKFFCLSRDK
jgi:hypothetical protein